MPARKPASLNTRHDLPADKAARVDAESAITPRTVLPEKPPAALTGRKRAIEAWKWLVKLNGEIDRPLATAWDVDLLVKYCLLEEEVIELAALRKEVKHDYDEQVKAARRFKPNAKQIKDYVNMWNVVNALFQRFQGMDARLDGKRKLLHAMAQSMYLTPRARAGVPPPEKEPEPPKTGMEEFLS